MKLMFANSRQKGFTLIEILIVVSVSALLMSLVVIFSHSGEKQIILLREQAKLVNAILRSKSLALQTFAQPVKTCGYGVHFIKDGYILFKDLADNCAASDKKYSDEAENIEQFVLDKSVKFVQPTPTDILYVPPDPRVVLNPDQSEFTITLASLDEKLSVKVKINNAGQVTVK